MSRATVKALVREIEALDDDERLQLQQELSKRLERAWTAQAVQARKHAQRKGINQSTIDQAIEKRRYSKQ